MNPSEKGDAETKKMLELCRWLYRPSAIYHDFNVDQMIDQLILFVNKGKISQIM